MSILSNVYPIKASASAHADIEDQSFIAVPAVAADLVLTLPPAKANTRGHRVSLTVGAVSNAVGHAVKVGQAADKIVLSGITALANKKVICTHGTETIGARLSLMSDGAGTWYATAAGTWAREA